MIDKTTMVLKLEARVALLNNVWGGIFYVFLTTCGSSVSQNLSISIFKVLNLIITLWEK